MSGLDQHPYDRQAVRERLTATRVGFHALLDGFTDDDLRRPSANPAWSVGAVLSHLVWSLELLSREVASARKGKGMFNLPPLLRDWLNMQLTRFGARGQTLSTLRRRYDAAFTAALATLDEVRDGEFDLGAQFWSKGFRDIAGLFQAQVDHFAEHGDDVRRVVPCLSTAGRTTQDYSPLGAITRA
jgi:hypothetical protein